jgi:hypothetical protein
MSEHQNDTRTAETDELNASLRAAGYLVEQLRRAHALLRRLGYEYQPGGTYAKVGPEPEPSTTAAVEQLPDREPGTRSGNRGQAVQTFRSWSHRTGKERTGKSMSDERLERIKQTDIDELPSYLATLPIAPGYKILPDLTEAEWAAVGQKFYYAEWLTRVGQGVETLPAREPSKPRLEVIEGGKTQ